MRALWKGTISFGLVSIPVSLYPAMRREELKFRLLRSSDQSPVNYKRVAAVDGKEVPWDQIVKGYEYDKGKFVILKDEDFNRVDVEAAQTVDIINFVAIKDVNPLLFYKPYYMEVGKGGDKAYSLLREALVAEGKIGIAKVVIKTRQHLAAVKPQDKGLMLELMHFPEELLDADEFKAPKARKVGAKELTMAQNLIESMSSPWRPETYQDDYREALEKLVEEKIKSRGKAGKPAPRKAKPASNVIDLVSVLQESIKASQSKPRSSSAELKKPKTKPAAKSAKPRKKAA